jgi:hypothetical protein
MKTIKNNGVEIENQFNWVINEFGKEGFDIRLPLLLNLMKLKSVP